MFKNIKYIFDTNKTNTTVHQKPQKYTFFYQICTFPDMNTNKYHLRKFIINDDDKFTSIKNYRLSKLQHDKFFKTKKKHEYKIYHTYDLEDVNYPTLADISMSRSNILNNQHGYSGFAPF